MTTATRQPPRPRAIKLKPQSTIVKIDFLNKQLIKILENDASPTSEVLAKRLGVSSATIRRRLKNLIDGDVIRIVATVNPDKVGLPLGVIMAFDVIPGKLEATTQALANLREVKWVSTTTGRFDISALAFFSNIDELLGFQRSEIAKIDGIKDSEISICLQMHKALCA